MTLLKTCANCGSPVVFGRKEGERHFCNDSCLDHFRHPGMCLACVAETTDESPGGTFTMNGIGTHPYGHLAKGPTCHSVIKRKWFCLFFIPLIPRRRFRIRPVTASRDVGRRIGEEKIRESKFRAASAPR